MKTYRIYINDSYIGVIYADRMEVQPDAPSSCINYLRFYNAGNDVAIAAIYECNGVRVRELQY
jgi:hypothetical protein